MGRRSRRKATARLAASETLSRAPFHLEVSLTCQIAYLGGRLALAAGELRRFRSPIESRRHPHRQHPIGNPRASVAPFVPVAL